MKWLYRQLIVAPYYALCQSENQFKKKYRKLCPGDPIPEFIPEGKGACAHFMENKEGETVVIVCISADKDIKPFQVVSILAHEAVHIWQHIRDEMYEKSPSHEFEAYCIQGITQQLVKAYRPKLRF